jgi:hypothetical protein
MKHVVPHERWTPPKHGYKKFLAFILSLQTMKIKTRSHPWMNDEIFVNMFRNMIVVEEFYNLPPKHKLTYWYCNIFFGTNKMLKHGIWFETKTKTWFCAGKVWNFWNFKDGKKIHYFKTCFTWTNTSYFSIEH